MSGFKGSGLFMILTGRVPNNARPDQQHQAVKPKTVDSVCDKWNFVKWSFCL